MPEVVLADQILAQPLPSGEKMPQIASAVASTAGRAGTCLVDGSMIVGKSRVLKFYWPRTGEGITLAPVASWKNAVEHVDSGSDRPDDVTLVAHSHEIPRPVPGEQLCREGDRLVNLFGGLSDCNTSDGVSRKIVGTHLIDTSPPESFVGSALDDPEERLIGTSLMCLDTTIKPPSRSIVGLLESFEIGDPLESHLLLGVDAILLSRGRAVIECHDDVSADLILDLYRSLRGQFDPGPVDEAPEGDAVFIH